MKEEKYQRIVHRSLNSKYEFKVFYFFKFSVHSQRDESLNHNSVTRVFHSDVLIATHHIHTNISC